MVDQLPVPLDNGSDVAQALSHSVNALPASLPVPDSTKSFWTHSHPDCNPLAAEGSDGALISTADVCIIGSGITGVSIAYHLSALTQAGAKLPRVAIIEARDFCTHPAAFCDPVNSSYSFRFWGNRYDTPDPYICVLMRREW